MPISEDQFRQMQERTERGKKKQLHVSPENCAVTAASMLNTLGTEADLHEAIIKECKHQGWIYFHGSMAHRAMRTLGEPDFIVLARGGKVFFIEAKSASGKLSVEQQGIIRWAETLGHKIHVVRTLAEFLEIVK